MTATRTFDMVSLEDAGIPGGEGDEVGLRSPEAHTMTVLPSWREPEDEWADAEIGRLYRLTKAGWDADLIAQTMGIDNAREVAQKQDAMKRVLERRTLMTTATKNRYANLRNGRPSKVTEEQVDEMVSLWNAGKTLRELAARFGLSMSGVQWVMKARRGEMA